MVFQKFTPSLSLEESLVISWVDVGLKGFSDRKQCIQWPRYTKEWLHPEDAWMVRDQAVFGECVEAAGGRWWRLCKSWSYSSVLQMIRSHLKDSKVGNYFFTVTFSEDYCTWRKQSSEYPISLTWEVLRFATIVLCLLHKSHKIFMNEERLEWGETGGKDPS